MKSFIFVLFTAMGFSLSAAVSAAQSPIQVLIVDGQSGGSYHNWKITTAILKKSWRMPGCFR